MKKTRVGITGYTGFIGSHLVDRLSRTTDISLVLIDDSLFSVPQELKEKVGGCQCLIHLAGMNRGKDEDVYSVNLSLAQSLVAALEAGGHKPHIIFSSSTWTETQTAFGRSKKAANQILMDWANKNNGSVTLLTIPNVFGDRGKPFYNSVVATFCYQLTHGETPKIIDDRKIELIYINELIEIIFNAIRFVPDRVNEARVPGSKTIAVSELLAILQDFKDKFFENKIVPALADPFHANLFNVFLSYIEYKDLAHFPKINADQRGELTEIIKLVEGGQLFFSITKPGVVRGNHYHTRKIERFCVIKGQATIKLRRIGTDKIIKYDVTGTKPEFVDIPIFYTHHIINSGQDDLYTLFWASELFNPADEDTYIEEVLKS